MMILWRERLAVLAVPKTGTTALETALAPHAAMSFTRPPMVKHMTLHRFNRFIRPYLEKSGLAEVKTVAVMREPVSWLNSWYRYRQRDALIGSPKSTANISFDTFVAAYLSGADQPEFAEVGAQARFLSGGAKSAGVDHLFRYENSGALQEFLQSRMGIRLDIPKLNISPRQETVLSGTLLQDYREKFAADFALYDSLPLN